MNQGNNMLGNTLFPLAKMHQLLSKRDSIGKHIIWLVLQK